MNITATVKKPWVKYTLITLAILFVLYILYKGMSGGNTTIVSNGATADPNAAAMAAHQMDVQADLTKQATAVQGQINLAQINNDAQTTQQNNALAVQLAIANLTTNAASHQNDVQVQGQIQLANINSQNIQTQVNANRDINMAQIMANTKSAELQTSALVNMASIQGHVQETLANYALQGQVSNNQASIEIARSQSGGGDDGGGIWGAIGGIASLFF